MKACLVTKHSCIADDIEIITVASDNNVVSVVYRPPNSCFSKSIGYLSSLTLFPQIIIVHIWVVILNISLFVPAKPQIDLSSLIAENGFCSVTRVTTHHPLLSIYSSLTLIVSVSQLAFFYLTSVTISLFFLL